MYESIHFRKNSLSGVTADYLRRHDVIYKRPALKGYEGLPIGNGRYGGLLYHNVNSLILPINHTEAIDFGADGSFQAWSWQSEEKNTAPFSCGEIKIVSPQPIFDWVYLENFEERLNLADAYLTGKAKTSFSNFKYKIYAPENPDAIIIDFNLEQSESAELVIRVEKWSTPNFFHHYEQVLNVHDKNLQGTSSFAEKEQIHVLHQTPKLSSLMSVFCEGSNFKSVRSTSHGCEFRFAAAKKIKAKIYITVEICSDESVLSKLTSEKDSLPLEIQNIIQTKIAAASQKEVLDCHIKKWHNFWNKSFLHIPDNYLENLYYIHLYQLNSCAKGKYPPLFGGLWTWFGDSRNWGHFYHWNHQQSNWGIYSAGQYELAENYFDYRFSMLDKACQDGSHIFNSNGAFYSDISNFNGYNALEPDTIRNLSVGSQITLDFYRHYKYTLDKKFLKEKTIPVLLSNIRLYLDLLKFEEENKNSCFRIKGGSTAYESYWNLKETLTDYSMIKAIFKIFWEIAEIVDFQKDYNLMPKDMDLIRKIQKELYSYSCEDIEHNLEALKIFSAGKKWNNEIVRYGEGEYPYSPFPATLFSPVWPSELIGIKDKGEKIFDIAVNTARVLFDKDIYKDGKIGCSGHAPAPQMAARLGMADDLAMILERYVQKYQIFPNGLMHFADIKSNQQWSEMDIPRVIPSDIQQTKWEELHDKNVGERTSISSEWFLHCYFEAAANICHGIQEALLQSYDGIIRLLPAIWMDKCVFRLHAEKGFIVSAEYVQGEVRLVSIESLFGNECTMYNPWANNLPLTLVSENENIKCSMVNNIISFATSKNTVYEIFRSEYPPDIYYRGGFENVVNQEPKIKGNNRIGLERIY